MNKKIHQKLNYSWTFLILGLLLVLSPNNALAIQNDLALTGLKAEIIDGECAISVSAYILVVGTEDYYIDNDAVVVQIYSSKDGGDWSLRGCIQVTKDESEVFNWNSHWPSAGDFPSEPNNEYIYNPYCNGNFRFKGKIIYAADLNPENDEHETPSEVSIACAGGCPEIICCVVFEDDDELFVDGSGMLDEWKDTIIFGKWCKAHPDKCPGIGLRTLAPEIFHFEGAVEIWFDNHINHFNLVVTTLSGQIISEMAPLRKPIKIKGVEYNQHLKFFKEKGMVYRLVYWPTKGTKVSKRIPFPILVRPFKPEHK